jgi:hypothetical protein
MAKKIAEEVPDEVEATDDNAKVEGTDVEEGEHDPRGDNVPEPGKTPDTQDLLNTDGAKALSPNITVSGTVPDGEGGQRLLDTVDYEVANAGILPPKQHQPPQDPSLPPEDTARQPGEGEVTFECTADNQPFWTGTPTVAGGPMKRGERYIMTREEAELLTQTKAGRVV